MSLLGSLWAIRWAWRAALTPGLLPLPPLAGHGLDDPCAPQYKVPSYDRRAFAEVASGFVVPQNRPLPYVVTPRLILLRPVDEAHRWSLSGSVPARFGDGESKGTIGARLHRSVAASASTILPRLALGIGPDLVLAHDGGVDGVVEATLDLTPLIIGARASWGPIRFNSEAFTHPARLETFIGWRIFGWRRDSTPLEELLHQPPPPRRRFRPQADPAWHRDFQNAIAQISDTLSYLLSLVQQLVIRFGAQFDHIAPDCGRQRTRLKSAKSALIPALEEKAGGATDVRKPELLAALLREQSEAFATTFTESVEYAYQAERYRPDALVLGPAVMHAMNCVLDGALSSSCIRIQQ